MAGVTEGREFEPGAGEKRWNVGADATGLGVMSEPGDFRASAAGRSARRSYTRPPTPPERTALQATRENEFALVAGNRPPSACPARARGHTAQRRQASGSSRLEVCPALPACRKQSGGRSELAGSGEAWRLRTARRGQPTTIGIPHASGIPHVRPPARGHNPND